MSRTNGLVLAGGRASRFGSDKRHALLRGETLLAHAVRKVAAVAGAEVFVATGPRVEALADVQRCVFLADAIGGRGPLGGIVAALRRSRRGLLVLACDVPGVSGSTLASLVAVGVASGRTVAPRTDRGWEPLVAYYPRAALTVLEAALRDGLLAPRAVLERLGAIALCGVGSGQLRNVNRPADLEAAANER